MESSLVAVFGVNNAWGRMMIDSIFRKAKMHREYYNSLDTHGQLTYGLR